MLDSNARNHLTVCKEMITGSFKNVTYKLFAYQSHTHTRIGFGIE